MGPAAGGYLTQPPQPSGAGEGSWASGEWSRLCACPHSSSPGPALPLLDPMTWFISQLPPPTPSFHQRSWASSPGAGEGRPHRPARGGCWPMPSAMWARPSVRAPASLAGFCSPVWWPGAVGLGARPRRGREHRREGPWGSLRDGALLGRGLPPAGGQGAAVVGPGRPHPGAPGAWLSLRGPRKQNQSTEVGPTGKFGPTGRAVETAAQRLRRGSLAQRWEQTGA